MWPFGKKNLPINLGDRVWIDSQKKYDNIIAEATQYIAEQKLILIPYYFQDTFQILSRKMEEKNVAFAKIQDAGMAVQSRINIVQSGSFLSQSFIDKLSFSTPEIYILFAEHYPLFSTENAIIKAIEPLGKSMSYCHYMSFDEPILARFGAERILTLLSRMGMKNDEAISHAMISSAIEKVQKKIDSKVGSEMKTNSMQEWFDKNLPSMGL